MPKNAQQNVAKLTTGSVGGSLGRMAALMSIGFAASAAFTVVDTYFVSELGTTELAAMGYIFPVNMVVFGLALGLGVGTSAVLSRTIGKGDFRQVKRITVDSLILGIILVFALIVIGLLTMKPLFSAMGADAKTLKVIIEYMGIWYIGVGFLVIPMIGNSAMRATGDMLTPSMIMVTDLGLNIILDPILIRGYGPFDPMGIKGAAIATVFCRGLALVASLYFLVFRKKMLTREIPTLSAMFLSWKKILYIGLPAVLITVMMPASMAVVNRILSGFGNEAVAAFGTAAKIERCVTIPIIALGSAMIPFVGQNWGAKLYGRVFQAQKTATIFALAWGALAMLVIFGWARPLTAVFTDDPLVSKYLIMMLWITPVAFGFRGLGHVSSLSMNAINCPWHSMGFMLIRVLVFQLPMAYIAGRFWGLKSLIISLVVTDIITGIMASIWIYRLYVSKSKTAI
ncbi:MAG: MATE family efflux transporter [Phycisphaerae bacterium]|nr:MATE family efflux transporter [Phycisphaerae bacterium]